VAGVDPARVPIRSVQIIQSLIASKHLREYVTGPGARCDPVTAPAEHALVNWVITVCDAAAAAYDRRKRAKAAAAAAAGGGGTAGGGAAAFTEEGGSSTPLLAAAAPAPQTRAVTPPSAGSTPPSMLSAGPGSLGGSLAAGPTMSELSGGRPATSTVSPGTPAPTSGGAGGEAGGAPFSPSGGGRHLPAPATPVPPAAGGGGVGTSGPSDVPLILSSASALSEDRSGVLRPFLEQLTRGMPIQKVPATSSFAAFGRGTQSRTLYLERRGDTGQSTACPAPF